MQPAEYSLLDLCTIIGYELIIAFQLVYIFFQWIFVRQREYLYYMAFMTACMVFGLLKYHHVPLPGISLAKLAAAEPFFDKALPMISYFFYFRFSRHFAGIPYKLPNLDRHIRLLEIVLLVYAFSDVILAFSGVSLQIREYAFQLIAVTLFVSTAYFVISFLRLGDKLANFLVVGGSVLTLGSVGAMVLLIMQKLGTPFSFNPLIFNLGTCIFELLAFTTGLAYKANLLEKEKTLAGAKLIEKLNENIRLQQKMNSIRHDAAKELHDEVAGGLSDINIYSDLVYNGLPTSKEKERQLMRQIHLRAIEMMDSIHDLIWALNPAHQKITDLQQKLLTVSRENLSPVNAEWIINFTHLPPSFELETDAMRRIVALYRNLTQSTAAIGLRKAVISDTEFTQLEIALHINGHVTVSTINERLLHLIQKYRCEYIVSDQRINLRIPLTIIRD
jgi:signal transduction histidine kinase